MRGEHPTTRIPRDARFVPAGASSTTKPRPRLGLQLARREEDPRVRLDARHGLGETIAEVRAETEGGDDASKFASGPKGERLKPSVRPLTVSQPADAGKSSTHAAHEPAEYLLRIADARAFAAAG